MNIHTRDRTRTPFHSAPNQVLCCNNARPCATTHHRRRPGLGQKSRRDTRNENYIDIDANGSSSRYKIKESPHIYLFARLCSIVGVSCIRSEPLESRQSDRERLLRRIRECKCVCVCIRVATYIFLGRVERCDSLLDENKESRKNRVRIKCRARRGANVRVRE